MIIEFDASSPTRNVTRTASPGELAAWVTAVRKINTWVGVSAPTPCTMPTTKAVRLPYSMNASGSGCLWWWWPGRPW